MWYVVETLQGNSISGEFGPFKDIEACVEFVGNSLPPWSSENMSRIEIVFREEDV